jgi:hypothetical protein
MRLTPAPFACAEIARPYTLGGRDTQSRREKVGGTRNLGANGGAR